MVGSRVSSRPAGTSEQQMLHVFKTGPAAKDQDNSTKYIQVHVPIPKPKHNAAKYKLVPITSFSPLAQNAFKGIKSLNRIQSIVFKTAYYTNHNLLICAPTGAGKTNVAMTCVVHEVERHVVDDVLDTSQVKIVYIAPMKALAQEVVDKFGKRLSGLGLSVRECTGDMQLTKQEIEHTQLIVTTPEKWDVITRKSSDGTLVEQVGLLIIDEVHLVGEDRGPVIESLIARTLRMVEQKQKMVRIVGLSATLPNYRDVAQFLRVDAQQGLFFFDNTFRPVPLDQTFIGVTDKSRGRKEAVMNDLASEHALKSVLEGNQVMIFVHSRNETGKTVRAILEAAQATGQDGDFVRCEKTINMSARESMTREVLKSRNAQLREFFDRGLGIHHAGMLRSDRNLTEKLFLKGAISVLCCTATLAWGVNLPAHTVIIKGTQVYVPEKGGLTELSMQDVFQCFGRAGRPQYDTSGEAILITEYAQLNRYLGMLNHALPLESHLDKHLPDALNAEIVSGSVSTMGEAVEWLSYTFLYVRMRLNPLRYGITPKTRETDPLLLQYRAQLLAQAAKQLDSARMSRFAYSMRSGGALSDELPLGVTDLGRVASHFYITHETIEVFNTKLKPVMTDQEILMLLCSASEFSNIKVREEESQELLRLLRQSPIKSKDGIDTPSGKALVLLQAYFSKTRPESFTLTSDMNYIQSNIGRICRAVFEIALKKRYAGLSEQMLVYCIACDRRCWWPPFAHPLRQFVPKFLSAEICYKLEEKGAAGSLESILESSAADIGRLVRHNKMGDKIQQCAYNIPYLNIQAHLQPLTRSILRVTLDISPQFTWHNTLHQATQSFWLWVEDQNSEWIYHSERLVLRKKEYNTMMKSQNDRKRKARAAPSYSGSMCITLHQPWASLMVYGIKRAEGRSWPSNFQGELFIHAAAKQPTAETIAQVEAQYNTIYAPNKPQFPKQYPTSCLLGSVYMHGCLTQSQFTTQIKQTTVLAESTSDYVFLCSAPKRLAMPFSMGGQHKMWRLPGSVLEAVYSQGLHDVAQGEPVDVSEVVFETLQRVEMVEDEVVVEKQDVDVFSKLMELRQSNNHPALVNTSGDELTATTLRREFTIPMFDPLPAQYFIRVLSDSFIGSTQVIPLSLYNIKLPPKRTTHTNLLNLDPLPISALNNLRYQQLYKKFTHFNPIQTQIFYVMYHTDNNVLLGAPTGSGKTISSELALLRCFSKHKEGKVVYIAPLKALVKERLSGWKKSLGKTLGKNVVELTGDVSPSAKALRQADIIITTPEKWDGITRKWKKQEYVKMVKLVVIDEIHLLGEERGAIIEVLVTRMRYISALTNNPIRIVGLSTALANAQDLSSWLGVGDVGLFNFRPAVRPVPLEVHIQGFPGKHYCPRMATMNKPAYQSIITHSPTQPVLVFVASRRQTRLTAIDLISHCASSDNPRRFLRMSTYDLQSLQIQEDTLRDTLEFGIGIHHAGLSSRDRQVVEELFVSGKIQVLVCTSTLAWGVNFPAHLVIIKGTEYYDAKAKRYQPFAVTDVLQMMGRAGRPQFDKSGVAMIFVHDILKDYYKKFLYEPFPVESRLPEFLHNHINAEIAAGSIKCKRDAIDYLSWTYFFRRLPMNPTFYGLEDDSPAAVVKFLLSFVDKILFDLQSNYCISLRERNLFTQEEAHKKIWSSKSTLKKSAIDEIEIEPTELGKIASYYYLSHHTVGMFQRALGAPADSRFLKALHGTSEEARLSTLAKLVADSHEYAEVPVRHNEDLINAELSKLLPWRLTGALEMSMESPHAKTFLLLQGHWKRVVMPIKDYKNDTKSVLDQAPRIINALIETSRLYGNLQLTLSCLRLSQITVQARWWNDNPLMQIRGFRADVVKRTKGSLRKLSKLKPAALKGSLKKAGMTNERILQDAVRMIQGVPRIQVSCTLGDKLIVEIRLHNTSNELPFAASFVKSKAMSCWILLAHQDDRLLHMESTILRPGVNTKTIKMPGMMPTNVHVVFDGIMGLDENVPIELESQAAPPFVVSKD